ncbi:HAD phosphatase, family IIIA [Pneumocystis carinii B80]|uniref:HAD phosphatase, family IIIA n=1 Tax=Pneumocystis carinii (strain B80) TaxID=1408658 RepID=A0A0W4ZMU3_PNEC8|nr:HAD phosphatase, family IIIA [Pneumocystis carinii B80]KTW29681.1 HAD phosphatase, family IIIA [Pneumocystis carinii B80]
MNIRAIIPCFSSLFNPSLLVPHLIINNFSQIPINISQTLKLHFTHLSDSDINIKALILDKDNCITIPGDLNLYSSYNEKWLQLKRNYDYILIVSNSSGIYTKKYQDEAIILEQNLGVSVFRHKKKKPHCASDLLNFLSNMNISPNQIVVIGDRLFTDILLGNLMGTWTIWIKHGISKKFNMVFLSSFIIHHSSFTHSLLSPLSPLSFFSPPPSTNSRLSFYTSKSLYTKSSGPSNFHLFHLFLLKKYPKKILNSILSLRSSYYTH